LYTHFQLNEIDDDILVAKVGIDAALEPQRRSEENGRAG
jgi:hypothetical protein